MKHSVRCAVVAVSVLLMGSGCGGVPPHESVGGPLGGLTDASGASGAVPPPNYRADGGRPWHLVDGDSIICTTTGKPIVIDKITYQMRVGSIASVRARIRSLTPSDPGPGIRTTITGLTGTFDHYRNGATTWNLAGTMNPARGFTEKNRCTRSIHGTFDEVMIQVAAGPKGAWLESFTVHYHVGSAHYRETDKWAIGLDGSDVRALCSDRDNPFYGDNRTCPGTGSSR